MPTKGLFIGVNRFADGEISELTSATRDATALHALFVDNVRDIEARLLVDEDAHHGAIREALDELLVTAGEDDVVIFTFAGHGTKDRRLVASDSHLDDLSRTTISLEVLREKFWGSPAKIVLCLLDCCFSGGATARVLENSMASRNPRALAELSGEGRIVFAACGPNEEAYEDANGHGLFTGAFIKMMQDAAEDRIDVFAVSSEIQRMVGAQAQQRGNTQKPVMDGTSADGLEIPRLSPGDTYKTKFPEKFRRFIASFDDLSIDPVTIDRWKTDFPGGLNALQLEAVNDYGIRDGDSLVVVAPTSSGKTFVGELAALHNLSDGKKVVFLLPYRALVNEKYHAFEARYGGTLGTRVIRCSGDHSDQAGQFVKGKFEIAILTYEMFLGLMVATPHTLKYLGLVVLDEAQFMNDPNRGIVVELILTKLLTARSQGIEPQILALSAAVQGAHVFADWLGCKCLVTHERPVPLEEGVLGYQGVFKYRVGDGGETLEKTVLESGEIMVGERARDLVIPLVSKLVAEGQKVLVFRNTKARTQGCALYLADSLGLESASQAIDRLPERDRSSTCEALARALEGGVAFHNSNLTVEERSAVEDAFRDPRGRVMVLAATTTLAAGVNTPADTVIVCEHEFAGPEGRPFLVSEYKNMVGRAGRLGYATQGTSFLLVPSQVSEDHLFDKYVVGELEPMSSSFDADDLDTWVLRLLAQSKTLPRREVVTLLANTFGGYLSNLEVKNWMQQIGPELEHVLDRMIEYELLEDELGDISLSLLGQACGNSALSFRSALRLVGLLRQMPESDVTPMALLGLVQCLDEGDKVYTPMVKTGAKERAYVGSASRFMPRSVVRSFQRQCDDNTQYYARAKRACILNAWIAGESIGTIEERFSTTPRKGRIEYGTVRNMADTTRYLLRSVADIAVIVHPGCEADAEALMVRLEYGLPAAAMPLLKLPVALTRGQYLVLHQHGISDPEAVIGLDDSKAEELLGRRGPQQLRLFQEGAAADRTLRS